MDSLGKNCVVLFQDECSVQYAPTIIRIWALKGQQPEIFSPGGRQRQHVIGAVDPFAGQIHAALSDSLRAEQFIQFLEGLLKFYSDKEKIIVVVDNARAHHAKLVEEFLTKRGNKLELMFLPPYSPNLKPIERFWRFMRKTVTHNAFFKCFKEFLRALITFFRKFKFPTQKIRSLCRII